MLTWISMSHNYIDPQVDKSLFKNQALISQTQYCKSVTILYYYKIGNYIMTSQ